MGRILSAVAVVSFIVFPAFFFPEPVLYGQETPAPATESAVPDAETPHGTVDDNANLPDEPPRRRRGRSRLPRARLPQGIFGEPETAPPDAEATLLGGTVPEIWEIERSSPQWDDDHLAGLLLRDTMAPPVPGKVVRYAVWLMEHYDRNGDGRLQEEEWKTLPGAPQQIDLNGDREITLEELVRYLAFYGRDRTIHRPHPVERYHRPKMASSQFQLFKPVSPPPETQPEQKPVDPAAETDETATGKPELVHDLSGDLTEEAMESNDQTVDDAAYEEIIAGRQVPASKKYFTPPEALRGVPAWFLLRDRDGDGQISLTEFAPTLSAPAVALFGKLDKNGDGFITPDEVRAPVAEPSRETPP